MSSSTMIHGATMRRASAIRTAAETTTMPASHSHAGTATARARAAATALIPAPAPAKPTPPLLRRLRRAYGSCHEPALARTARELAHVFDPDLGRRLRDPPQHGVRDRRAAGGLLERTDVRIGDEIEVVHAPDVVARGSAELARVAGGELECRRGRRHLVLGDGPRQRGR